ncbi:MAG: hypothetical protein IJD91_01230 [Clostridia bacterium]|nr:hypothetical protein [Clostridia bacterium]
MKKKAAEALAQKRQRIIEGLERLLRERKKSIALLQREKRGLEQVVQMLSAIILEGIERSGRVEIKKADISEGLRSGYTVSQTEDAYVIERVV